MLTALATSLLLVLVGLPAFARAEKPGPAISAHRLFSSTVWTF